MVFSRGIGPLCCVADADLEGGGVGVGRGEALCRAAAAGPAATACHAQLYLRLLIDIAI